MPLRPPTTVLIGLTAAVAAVPSTTVVVNELHTNNQPGRFDTFVELRNVSAGPVDISGWQLFGCNGSRDTGLRATIDPGTELAAGEHYLLTAEGYGDSYDVPGDQALSTSLTPDGGIRLVASAGSPVDAVGHQAEACVEGNPAPQPADRQQTVSRDAAGTDTDNNADDFSVGAATPTASAEDSAPDPGGETPGTDAIGLEIRTDRVIGTQRVESGQTASATWRGLRPDLQYAWYAVAADDFGGVAAPEVFRFTTGDRTTGRPAGAGHPEEPGRPAFASSARGAAERRLAGRAA